MKTIAKRERSRIGRLPRDRRPKECRCTVIERLKAGEVTNQTQVRCGRCGSFLRRRDDGAVTKVGKAY